MTTHRRTDTTSIAPDRMPARRPKTRAILLLGLTALLAACSSGDDNPDAKGPGSGTDAPESSGEAQDDAVPDATDPQEASQLPAGVDAAVLGDHDPDWFVWSERANWTDEISRLCDPAGEGVPDPACTESLDRAIAGSDRVLGPYEVADPTLGLIVQGLWQQVVVFADETDAAAFLSFERDVVQEGGILVDLELADESWIADYSDEGTEADLGAGVVVRIIALRQGPTVVLLNHVEDPDDPRLDTMPFAERIAERLAEAR